MKHLPALAVVLLAVALREWFVLATTVLDPSQGDVAGYLRYALHLAWDGTFSETITGPVVPDAYRGPGYPAFLASLYLLTGAQAWDSPVWFGAIYHAQAVLGAATVACVIAMARQWLPMRWGLLAGVLLAVQPHHISATKTILSEVVFGFALASGVLMATWAVKRKGWAWGAGVMLGYAYLVNPLALFLPLALLPVFWRERALRQGVIVAVVALAFFGGWGLRNAAHGLQGSDRATINFVQGSHPDYHYAAKRWPLIPAMKQVMDTIVVEVDAIKADKVAGLRMIGDRLAQDPVRAVRWYVLEKPFLLWDWDIKMGAGGTNVHYVRSSPLDGPLFVLTGLMWALKPLLFALALVGMVTAKSPTGRMVAMTALYLTALHVVFQAEPRYATAYRWAEVVLAGGGAWYVWEWARKLRLATSMKQQRGRHDRTRIRRYLLLR